MLRRHIRLRVLAPIVAYRNAPSAPLDVHVIITRNPQILSVRRPSIALSAFEILLIRPMWLLPKMLGVRTIGDVGGEGGQGLAAVDVIVVGQVVNMEVGQVHELRRDGGGCWS